MAKKRGFILIPDEIAERDDLTCTHKVVIGQLARLQGDKACCYPSYEGLAKLCGISKRQAIRTVNDLVLRKEVLIFHHKLRSNTYSVPWKSARNLRKAYAERRQNVPGRGDKLSQTG